MLNISRFIFDYCELVQFDSDCGHTGFSGIAYLYSLSYIVNINFQALSTLTIAISLSDANHYSRECFGNCMSSIFIGCCTYLLNGGRT